MEGRLNANQRKAIERFIHSGPKELTLLYSFTRDDADNTKFHAKCDNRGPTVTVIYNTKGSVYGGYTEKSWTSAAGTFSTDDKAFLFRLMHDQKDALNKFPIKTPDQAIYCHTNNGPVFGSNDIVTFSGTLTKSGAEYTMNGSFSIGTSFDMGGITLDQLTNNIQTVYDLEVYTVKDVPVGKQWRNIPGWDKKTLLNLKHDVEAYAPPSSINTDTANILVLGPVGAGKSSFFNTIASVIRGSISDEAVCGSAEQSITSKYRMFRVRKNATSTPLQFCLCDTRGLEESCGIDGQELNFILDGNVPDGYEFNPTKQISSDTYGFKNSPTLGQKIHCVCFILDGSTASVLSDKMVEKIKTLQTKIRQKEIPHLFVLTKIDKVCSSVEEDVSNVFQSEAIKNLVEQVSASFGVSRNQVLPMKNYEVEVEVDNNIDILALVTLQRLLSSTESHFNRYLVDTDSVGGTKKK